MQEYEAFGSLLPGRNYSSSSYRFGFQGQEKDDEIYGAEGTALSFTYRIHDARVGRFLSIDPLAAKYPWNSPYAFAENAVIQYVELEGLEKGVKKDRPVPILVPPIPGPGLTEPLFHLSKVRLVSSVREYGENVQQHGDNVELASLALVPANPVVAESMATVGGSASLLGTSIQAFADIREKKYVTAGMRLGLMFASYRFGEAVKSDVQTAKLPEKLTTAINISIGIGLGEAEGLAMDATEKNRTAAENNAGSSRSSSSSSTPAAPSPVTPIRTTGTDQVPY